MNLYAMTAAVVEEGVLDGIPAIIGVSSPLATALAMVYLIFTGRLYVRSAHDDMIRVLEAAAVAAAASAADSLVRMTKDRDTWRDSSLAKDETIRILSETNSTFVESAKFQHHVMSALQESAGRTS